MELFMKIINKIKENGMTLISIICMALAVVLTMPTIYISKYAYPWADDFSYSSETYKVFCETGSFFKAVARAAMTSIESYHDWQGTFTSCFLMAMQPSVFGIKLYHFTGFIMLGTLFVSYFVLFLVVCHRVLRLSKATALTVFALTYLVSTQLVKSIPESFTWFNGAIHYTFNHAMFVLYLALIVLLFFDYINIKSGIKRITCTIILCVFGFFVAGGNNITVLTGVVTLVIIYLCTLLYCRIRFEKQSDSIFPVTIIAASYILGAVLNFTAPGNLVRMSATGNTNSFFATIINSFVSGGYSVYYNFSVELAMTLILIGVFIWHELSQKNNLEFCKFEFPLPGAVLLISYCVLSAEYAPLNYTSVQGTVDGIITSAFSMNRVNNCIYFSFVLLIIFNEIYFLCWLKKNTSTGKAVIVPEIVLCVLAVSIASISVSIKVNNKPTTFLTSAAVYNLKTGSAQYYGYQMQENINRLESDEKDVFVMPLSVDPDSLYPKDAADWKDGTKHFYGKDSVEYEE